MSIAFILLCFLFYNKNSEKRLVNACSKAIILWVALAYFSLEILSIFNKVTFFGASILLGEYKYFTFDRCYSRMH